MLSPFEWMIAKRYLWPGKGEAFIALVAAIGYGGFLLGPPVIGFVARHLGLPAGHPCAQVQRSAYDLSGRCVEMRITRGDDFQSLNVRGLYPAGEGASYAGGILSAGVDGLKVAEALARDLLAGIA